MYQSVLNYGIRISYIFLLVSCGAEEVIDEDLYSNEHRLLLGGWEQNITKDSCVLWSFTTSHLTWGNFTHRYKVTENDVFVSGLKHTLLYQSEDTLKMISPQGDTLLLEKIRE